MHRSEFQPSENHTRPKLAGFFVSGVLLAASVPASANETPATATFPLVASFTPPATAAFAPTPVYRVPVANLAAKAADRAAPALPPEAYTPNDPNWAVPPASPAPAPATPGALPGNPRAGLAADARGDRGAASSSEAREGLKPWMLALEGYTSVPVDLGGRVTFETPFRLRLSAAFGIVPGAYFGVVNSAVESSGAYDAFGADVVNASLDSGNVWRAMIGVRPIGGLYADAGYARIGLSGGLQADQFSYSIDSTLHMWTLEIGYQGQVADRLVLALGIGVMKTFAASSSVAADFELGRSANALAITDQAVAEYDEKLEHYGIVPTLTARVGWDLF